jgi:hypothetical protein
MDEVPYVRQPTELPARYAHGPDSFPQPEVPRGQPLRIWLHVATRDLNWDKPEDNWLSAGLEVAAALAERGYDFRLVVGDGAHDGNHGGVLLPDALRWLWRPEPGAA